MSGPTVAATARFINNLLPRWSPCRSSAGGTLRTQNNMCLDVAGGSTANGAVIQIAACSGNDGAALQLWDCAGTTNQKWHRG